MNESKFILYFGLPSNKLAVTEKDSPTKKAFIDKFITLCPSLLSSFAHKDHLDGFCSERVDRLPDIVTNLMIDSGAFSVWRSGAVIDLREYIDWIHLFRAKWKKWFNLVFVSLDVIPGSRDNPATYQEVIEAAEQSLENYLIMRELGVKNLMVVYHYGEPKSHLDSILKHKPEHLGLGAMASGVGSRRRGGWLDETFLHLQNKGYEGKVHGFGIMASNLVLRHPWKSVDSTSYYTAAEYGNVSIFEKDKIINVLISELKVKPRKMVDHEKEWLIKSCHIKGVTWEEIQDRWVRWLIGLKSWILFERYVREYWKNKQLVYKQPSFLEE